MSSDRALSTFQQKKTEYLDDLKALAGAGLSMDTVANAGVLANIVRLSISPGKVEAVHAGETAIFAMNSAVWSATFLSSAACLAAFSSAFCFSMSRYSLWIEKRLNVSKTR